MQQAANIPAIPIPILRAGYELERDAWQRDLARLQARMEAQQHIAAALGRSDAAQIQALAADMEAIALGLVRIEELLAALPAEGITQRLVSNGKDGL